MNDFRILWVADMIRVDAKGCLNGLIGSGITLLGVAGFVAWYVGRTGIAVMIAATAVVLLVTSVALRIRLILVTNRRKRIARAIRKSGVTDIDSRKDLSG